MSTRLISLPPDNLATAKFLVVARQNWSFLNGQLGMHQPGDITLGADNAQGFAKLLHNLQQRYASAGKPFWAVRIWTNLVWQPAYLAIVGVHHARILPDVCAISQKVVGADINGFVTTPTVMHTGPVEDLIDQAGADLRRFAEAMLAEASAYAKIKPTLARRLLADRILGLVLQLFQEDADYPVSKAQAIADRWLAAMGLTGASALEPIDGADGHPFLILDRRTCCLDYLLNPDALCVTCPKQGDELRHRRERETRDAILRMQ